MPDYARPLEGSFGQGVRTGVSEALRQFVELIRSPSGDRGPGREVYAALGAGELREGRTLDALQSAYRVGARVAWRRLAAAATRAGVEPEVLSLLAESIFAYIEELSADSVEGYAEARSRLEGERRRRRRELVTLLVRDPPAAEADLRAASRGGGLARFRERRRRSHAARSGSSGSPRGCPRTRSPPLSTASAARSSPTPMAPAGATKSIWPSRRPRSRGALGPTGPLRALGASWSLARATLRAVEAGAIEAPALVRVEDALTELLLFENGALVERLAARRLAAFDALTPKARRRMEETALAYVQQQGNAAAMSRALGLHAQTARYRLSRLRELLGDALDDPDGRFELELALRARLREGAVQAPQ